MATYQPLVKLDEILSFPCQSQTENSNLVEVGEVDLNLKTLRNPLFSSTINENNVETMELVQMGN